MFSTCASVCACHEQAVSDRLAVDFWCCCVSRADIPVLTSAEAGTRLSDPGGMQG